MISPQQFIELWGSEDLMSYDRSRVQALTIPAVSKRFLIQAGLPCLYPTQFPCPELPLLGETYGSDYTFPAECFPYRVLSVIIHKNTVTMEDSIFAFYCLDEQAVGRIMELYSGVSKEMRVYFRNSSIPQFAEFCLVFRQYDRWVTQRNQEQEQGNRPFYCDELDAQGEEVRRMLRQVDPNAFFVPEGEKYSHWETILLEFEMATGCIP